MSKKRFLQGAIFFLVTLLLGACAPTKQKAYGIPEEIAELLRGKYSVDPSMMENPPRTVAILPFENLTEKEEAFGGERP